MRTIRLLVLGFSLGTASAAGVDAQALRTSSQPAQSRDEWQRVPDIISALGLAQGSRVADVGAGEGWLSTRLAKFVGPAGRVFAVDISESSIQALQRNASTANLDNIELILGEPDDPRLPYGSLDGIVIVNAYHEMVQRVAMLDAFKRALKPTGVLVIVDNIPFDSVTTRSRQTNSHQLGLAFAEDDLTAQGFEIVRREPQFISGGEGEHPHRQWLLVARKIKK